ncbi:MAG: hypothetical protein WCQ26_06565 [Pseudanabaena sp. ELA748]
MKAVRLNLEDRQAWQKLQHILTSLASDYMDLVAAEQTEFKFEQQVLSIAFTLIAADVDRDRLNEFTQTIDRYFTRLQLVGVRRIEWEFYVIGEDLVFFAQGRDIQLVSAPAPLPQNALARNAKRSPVRNNQEGILAKGRSKFSNLVQRVRGWLVDPKTIQAARTTSRITIRDPRGALDAVRVSAIAKFNDTIQWVDTFPWEAWTKEKTQQIKRRHQRNLVRSVIEDLLVFGVMLIAAFWLIESLSPPSFNLALLPKQHFDSNMTNAQYRCGNPDVNLKNYVCLSRGMRYDQVASILGSEGKPLGIDHKFGDRAVVISWSSPELSMNATFVNDQLVTRAYRQLSASK